MALITCPECGREISEYAESCPGCGCPKSLFPKLAEEQRMKAAFTDGAGVGAAATGGLSGGPQRNALPSSLSVGERFRMGSWGGRIIWWRVLDSSGNRILAISEDGLDCKPFNSSRSKGNSWSASDLCNWLNSTFFTGAFSDDEQSSIRKVTCLSIEEAGKYFADNKDRICEPTPVAVQLGARIGSCLWWLRSPGSNGPEFAAYVGTDGSVFTNGWFVDYDFDAVRPALILNL